MMPSFTSGWPSLAFLLATRIEQAQPLPAHLIDDVLALVEAATEADGLRPVDEHVLLQATPYGLVGHTHVPSAFIERIDAKAQKIGLTKGDDYMAQFKWSDEQSRPGTPQEVAAALKAELEATLTKT